MEPVQNATVYIVDDDAGVRGALAWLLRTRRLPSEVFDSAEAFDARVSSNFTVTGPSCVLLDVRMAGMSGLAMFDKLIGYGLLTTLPGEEHQLGLLMAQACLTVEGAQCISLGVQTPAGDIAQAARAHRADVVGLSFSSALQMPVASAGLADLRQRLDRDVALWAGGAVWP